jgi:acyl carrier protein
VGENVRGRYFDAVGIKGYPFRQVVKMSDIDARVKTIIAEHLGLEESRVAGEMALFAGLYVSSPDGVDLATALENEFRIFIPDCVVPYMNTVQDIIDYAKANHRAGQRNAVAKMT